MMKKMKLKTLFTLLLALVLIACVFPVSSFAYYYGPGYYSEYYDDYYDNYYYRYDYYERDVVNVPNLYYNGYYGNYYGYNDSYYGNGDYSYHYSSNSMYDYNNYGPIVRGKGTLTVDAKEDMVYTGTEEISYLVQQVGKSSLMSVVVFPKGDRNKEVILEKGDYKITGSNRGVTITLDEDFLDTLKDGQYEIRMFFISNQADGVFEVDN